MAGGMLRDLRPMLNGSPSASSTRPTIVASHNKRRAVSSASAGPSSSLAAVRLVIGRAGPSRRQVDLPVRSTRRYVPAP